MANFRLRSTDVAWSDIGSEIVILDLRSSRYFSASGTSALLVKMLAVGAERDDLVGRVLAEYDTTAETAAADIDAFLLELRERDLLDAADA